ncbi:MAG: hypothetical protein ACM3MK_04475, partial [Chitinophagales bacterium]
MKSGETEPDGHGTVSFLKLMLQKRLRTGGGCRGKPLDCVRCTTRWGLKCALSGNLAPHSATKRIE